ncbi:MAG: YifB family Mg chelatase-like AAA ATPase [Gammaproteobacteria bacterium]|nr:YifB family Mg chelatase-like AAA ATPase [Gammaproteobacteria bacterium]
MSLAIVLSRDQLGIAAPLVRVEVHLSNGLPGLTIVGLPEAAVRESKDRVRAALLSARFEYPSRRMTVNLSPADLPKEGGRYDLAIALGILAASGQVPVHALADHEFVGELGLNGELRPVRGIIPVTLQSRAAGRCLVVPKGNRNECGLIPDARTLHANDLLEVCAHLRGQTFLPDCAPETETTSGAAAVPDLAEVRGQLHARRTLEIAAAGGHSLLFVGPPGSGKTMLASRLPGILPPMNEEEALETAAIYSLTQHTRTIPGWRVRPFRAPHHTCSAVALVGGGSHPRPGEISLANNGILFLDELPEFDRHVLEVLREPMESGTIAISRAAQQVEYPARFQLVAAMNPCPCGHLGDPAGHCHCSAEKIQRYRQRISGPLLDRIDMHVEVPAVPISVLTERAPAGGEDSVTVRSRVVDARNLQIRRQGKPNFELSAAEINEICPLDNASRRFLQDACTRLGMSARAYYRIIRVARSIADLAGNPDVRQAHLAEAVHFRKLDRRAG